MDPLTIGQHTFTSRLILGTGKFADAGTMTRTIQASGAQVLPLVGGGGHDWFNILCPWHML